VSWDDRKEAKIKLATALVAPHCAVKTTTITIMARWKNARICSLAFGFLVVVIISSIFNVRISSTYVIPIMKEEDATRTDFDTPVVNNYNPALARSIENITTALETTLLGVSIERNDVSPTEDSAASTGTRTGRIVAQEAAPAVPMTHNYNFQPIRKPAAKSSKRQMSSALGLVNATDPHKAQHLHNLTLAPVTSAIPWSNKTTLANAAGKISSGFLQSNDGLYNINF
jgi:hypothetical protein